jgi:hypothetical protein
LPRAIDSAVSQGIENHYLLVGRRKAGGENHVEGY